jgi:hypothetical protein
MSAHDPGKRRPPTPHQGRLPDRSLSRALLIGVSVYLSSTLENVPAAANNVHQLQDVLTGHHGGFARDHCEVLLNWDDRGRIGGALEDAAREAEDVLLVYFTGHGLHGPGQDGPELLLALPSTDPGLPTYTALQLNAIRETFRNSKAPVKILILDCCYSGLAIGRPLSGPGLAAIDRLAIKGSAILASSGPYEQSRTRDGHPCTAFTDALVSVLRDGIPGAGPLLKLSDVADHTQRRLATEGFPASHRLEVGDAGSLALVRNQRAGHDDPPRGSRAGPPGGSRVTSGRQALMRPPPDARPAVDKVTHAAGDTAGHGSGVPNSCHADAAASSPADPVPDPARAPDPARELIDIRMRRFGPGHPAVFASRRSHAEQAARAGETASAGLLLRGLVEDAERILGPLAPETLQCRLALSRWMSTQEDGDAVATVHLLTELEQALAAVFGHHDPATRTCRSLRNSRDLRRRETEQILREAAAADPQNGR